MRARLIAALLLLAAAPVGANPAPPQKPEIAQQPPPAASGTLKTRTRLITVDVVATDSHGKAVRGLTAQDFRIFDKGHGPQTIAHFEFVDHSAAAAAPPKAQPTRTAPV